MIGKRVEYPGLEWREYFKPGNYWKADDGWRGVTPNGLLCWLKNHHVEEHEDGTISVVAGTWGGNSILASNGTGNKTWHGYIVQGKWEEC